MRKLKLPMIACLMLLFSVAISATTTPMFSRAPSGLVGWWKLVEGSGSTGYDSSSNKYNGTWSGTASCSSTYYTAGKVGPHAGCFDGSTDYIVTGMTAAKAPTTSGTISFWMYATAFTSFASPISNGNVNSDTNGVTFYFGSGSTSGINFELEGASSSQRIRSVSNLSTGQWYFIAGTWNGSTIHLYVSGQTSVSATQGVVPTPGYALTIGDDGARSLAGNHFNGYICDVRVYNRALTAGEVALLELDHN